MSVEWCWLESTKRLQEEAFDRTFPLVGDDLADYVIENHTALVVELGELLQEVGWKPWTTPRGWVNREAAVGELVDAAHFLANLAVALGVTDEEWQRRYRAKQEVNRARQRSGYDGVSGKCPRCRRSLDDPGVACRRVEEDNVFTRHGEEANYWCARDVEYGRAVNVW